MSDRWLVGIDGRFHTRMAIALVKSLANSMTSICDLIAIRSLCNVQIMEVWSILMCSGPGRLLFFFLRFLLSFYWAWTFGRAEREGGRC